MIVVDSSVWIAHFRNERSPQVATLRALPDPNLVLVGDIILLESLQGARSDAHARRIEDALRVFPVEPMLDDKLAVEAARHYRALQAVGVTPRKTIDLVIATFCIARRHRLLHQDHDFEALEQHLGLQVI